MRAAATGLVLSVVCGLGCFAPDAREGLPCSQDGDCPPGQDCFQVGGDRLCAAAAPVDGAPADAAAGLFAAPERVELLCDLETPCASPRDPSLTDDLTQLFFTVESSAAPGDHDLYRAVREAADGAWPVAGSAGLVNTLEVEEGSQVTGDGRGLWFRRASATAAGPPYGDLWVSTRAGATDPFDSAAAILGVVNTAYADERGVDRADDSRHMVFGRALDVDLGDHDPYLAEARGAQWDTVRRLDRLAVAGADERSFTIRDHLRTLLFVRGDRIVEARWPGDDIGAAEVALVHDELAVAGAEVLAGVWLSPDGGEVWFGACGGDTGCGLYRAVRR